MEALAYIGVVFAYGFLTVAFLLPAMVGERGRDLIGPIGLFGVALHIGALATRLVIQAHPPGLSESLSATALGIAIACVTVARGRRLRSLGMFLAPLALVGVGIALSLPEHRVAALAETGFSPWLPVHLFLLSTGTAGLALAAGVGGLYLWARHRLKTKRLAGLQRIPSLEVLDRIQFRSMLFGFVFLTLGIGVGGVWASVASIDGWMGDAKVWFTLVVWFWYGLALQLRLVFGQRGLWTARFSVVGFAALGISIVGVNFLLSEFHGYGS